MKKSMLFSFACMIALLPVGCAASVEMSEDAGSTDNEAGVISPEAGAESSTVMPGLDGAISNDAMVPPVDSAMPTEASAHVPETVCFSNTTGNDVQTCTVGQACSFQKTVIVYVEDAMVHFQDAGLQMFMGACQCEWPDCS